MEFLFLYRCRCRRQDLQCRFPHRLCSGPLFLIVRHLRFDRRLFQIRFLFLFVLVKEYSWFLLLSVSLPAFSLFLPEIQFLTVREFLLQPWFSRCVPPAPVPAASVPFQKAFPFGRSPSWSPTSRFHPVLPGCRKVPDLRSKSILE